MRILVVVGTIAVGFFGGGILGLLLGFLVSGADRGLHGGEIIMGFAMICGAFVGSVAGFIYSILIAKRKGDTDTTANPPSNRGSDSCH